MQRDSVGNELLKKSVGGLLKLFNEAKPTDSAKDFKEKTNACVEKMKTENTQEEEKIDVFEKILSPELQKKIDQMYKSIPPHVDVFPEPIPPGKRVLPTGRLCRCICSPGCQKELPQIEYYVASDSRFAAATDQEHERQKNWNGCRAKKGAKKRRK